jgi:pyruvate formate lyase activating enzyme
VNLGGLVRFTLTDYPGRAAAVVFTQGCNFRCPFCHNGRLLPRDAAADDRWSERAVLSFLQTRAGQLSGLVVSGGEPTLQADLPRFLHRVKALGYAVKLDTNGSRPEVLRQLLCERLLDFVAMDVKAPWEHYARLAGVPVDTDALRASVGLLAQSGIPHEFRTTVVPPLLTDADLADIANALPAGSPHRCQPFRPTHALAAWLRSDPPHPQAAPLRLEHREGITHEH